MAQDRLLNFSLRGGVGVAPAYPGADDFEVSPDLGIQFGALRWGRIDIGNGVRALPDNGLSLGGAFRVLGDRDVADNPKLTGLDDIDTAVELGVRLTYQETNWMVFGEVRQGFVGHHGVTGTLGGDLIFRPDERLTITAGPRLSMGNSEFARTYFGVTPAQAAASTFGAFDASGGLLGAGAQIGATYALDENWAIEGALNYERLQGDAADSPITLGGSRDQVSLRIGVSRQFNLRF